MKVKKKEYFISKNQVKNQEEWLWGFLSKNRNNLNNSIGYWAGFWIKTQDCIPPFKCIEPMDSPHTHCSLTFKKSGPDMLSEISNFHRPRSIVDLFLKKIWNQTHYYQKNYIPTPHWCERKKHDHPQAWSHLDKGPYLRESCETMVKWGKAAEESCSWASKSCKNKNTWGN